jgi:hypothetical protein
MAQIHHVANFSLNLGSLNESGERNALHNGQRPINPSQFDKSLAFLQMLPDQAPRFGNGPVGIRSRNSLEIDSDTRFSQALPPMKES